MTLFKLILVPLLAIALIPPGLNMVCFILENRTTGHFQVLKTRSRLPLPFLLLRGTLSALMGNIYWLIGVRHYLHFGLGRPETSDPGQPAVVMVHGLYHNSSAWRSLKKRFQRQGVLNWYTWSYPSFGRSFKDVVQDCTRALHQVASAHPEAGLIVIGHSLGGLILRQALCDPGVKSRVLALITLGTPHQGTRTARMGIGSLAKGLVPDGSIIQYVRNSGCTQGTKAVSLFSSLDTMVVPASGLRISEPGWQEVETAPTTHVAMLFNQSVGDTVLEVVSNVQCPGSNG